MTQEEVMKVLEDNGDWMVIGEIMAILHCSRGSVQKALKSMYKYGEIGKRQFPRLRKGGLTTQWKYKDMETEDTKATKDAQNGLK